MDSAFLSTIPLDEQRASEAPTNVSWLNPFILPVVAWLLSMCWGLGKYSQILSYVQ